MIHIAQGTRRECFWHKTLRMLKFHPITAFMKMYTNFKKMLLVRVFWLKYIFRIKFKISTLDLMLLPKNSFPFEGLYYSNKHFFFPQLLPSKDFINFSLYASTVPGTK